MAGRKIPARGRRARRPLRNGGWADGYLLDGAFHAFESIPESAFGDSVAEDSSASYDGSSSSGGYSSGSSYSGGSGGGYSSDSGGGSSSSSDSGSSGGSD